MMIMRFKTKLEPFVVTLLAAACSHPSAEPPIEVPVETPSTPETTTADRPEDAPTIHRLALGQGDIATLTERGIGYLGSDAFGAWLADRPPIEDIWLGAGAICVRTESGVSCKLGGLHPFAGKDELRLELPTEAALIDLDWTYRSVCVLSADGATWCSFGRDEAAKFRRFPVSDARDIEIHDDFGCARRDDRSAVCWLGKAIQFGEFCKQTRDAPGCQELETDPAAWKWPAPSEQFTDTLDIAVGHEFVCVLDGSGVPYCRDDLGWGVLNRVGKLGRFTAITGMPALVEIDAGDRHVCGRSESDEVWCWGANDFGQLGDGGTQSNQAITPVRAGSFPALDQLALSGDTSCVLADARVQCWGHRLDTPLDPIPNEIPGVRASKLEVSATSNCARVDAGWKCWGGDAYTPAGVLAVSEIVAGEPSEVFNLGCQVRADTLRCFDRDESDDEDEGETWLKLRGVIDVVRTSDPLCVLRDKRVECHEAYDDSPIIIPVPTATKLEGSSDFGCVLTRTGEVHCWADEMPSTRVELPGKQVQVAVSDIKACALDGAGAVRCWYYEEFKAADLSVAAITQVVELRAGLEQICARDRAGKIACWGEWLLDDDEFREDEPHWLDLPGPALEFGLGDEHGCARLDNGRVYCWGAETSGQRGRLPAEYVLRPALVDVPITSAP